MTNRINNTEKYKDLVNKLKFIHYNDEVTSFRPMKVVMKWINIFYFIKLDKPLSFADAKYNMRHRKILAVKKK